MNIVFLGTPEISKICLEKLYHSKHNVLAVFTQPDKPSGRGNKLKESEVKVFAREAGIPVFQYENVSKDGLETLKSFKPDALVLVAFGQILSEQVLSVALPLNLHGSLLPKYRGASPIQTAILNGETVTGATVMKMEKGLDSGEILLQKQIPILPSDNSLTLFNKMGEIGGDLLIEALNLVESGNAKFTPQDHSKATFTQKLTKENAIIDFSDTAYNIVNKIRAYNPNPVAYFMLNDKKIKVFSAEVVELNKIAKPGEIISADAKNGLVIATQNGGVKILSLQSPNGKVMQAKDFLNGFKINLGVVVN